MIQAQPTILIGTENEKPALLPNGTLVFAKDTHMLYSFDSTFPNSYRPVYATSDFFVQLADKTVANTTVETSLFSPTVVGSRELPVNFLGVGRNILVHLRGVISRQNGNITIKLKLNNTVIMGVAGSIGSCNQDVFNIDGRFTIRTVGVNGTLMGQGSFMNYNNGNILEFVNLTPVTIDTTIVQTLDCTFQWANANAGNVITCTNAIISI